MSKACESLQTLFEQRSVFVKAKTKKLFNYNYFGLGTFLNSLIH